MTKPHTSKTAFTLIEVLVASSLGLIIVTVMTLIFVRGWEFQQDQEALSKLQSSLRLSVDEISKRTRQAKAVVPSYSDGTTTYTTNQSTLVIQLSSVSAAHAQLPANDYIVFRLNPTSPAQLERLIFADNASTLNDLASPFTLADNITTAEFSYYDPNGTAITDYATVNNTWSIEVSLEAQAQSISRSFSSTVYLRNKE